MFFLIELSGNLLLQEAILIQFEENVLSDLCLKSNCSSTKDVETNVESLVYLGVNNAVLIAKFFWRAIL
jgi:hypothetical protein